MPKFSKAALFFLLTAVFYSTGCGDFFVSGDALDHITLDPTAVFLQTGEQVQFTATAVTVDGDSSDTTSSANWTVGSNIATVSSPGLIKAGTNTGNTTVMAASGGVSGVANLVIGVSPLGTNLVITPNNPTVSATNPVQLKATGASGGTVDLTNFVTWTSSDPNITVSSTGAVSVSSAATSGETSTITATIATAAGTASGNVTVTVQ